MPFDGTATANAADARPVHLVKRSKSLDKKPRRLSDDLRWRCNACKSLVTTKDTHFHLLGCLMTLVNPSSSTLLDHTSPTCKCLESLMTMESSEYGQSSSRPRTKR